MSKSKKKRKKKKNKGQAPEATPEVDGRSAARALKKALAESDAKAAEIAQSKAKGRARDKTGKIKKADPGDSSEKESPASDDAPIAPKAPRRRRPPTSMGVLQPRPVAPEIKPRKDKPVPGAHRPAFHRRHDIPVLIAAMLVLATGAILSRSLAQTAPRRFDRLGLSFNRPALFLPPQRVEPPSDTSAADGTKLPYHVVYQSPFDPLLRLEVLVDERPAFNNLRATRALDRASQHGEMVWTKDSQDIKISGRLWLRTEYQYAYKASEFDSPKVATGIESATLNGALLYVVTFHGNEDAALELANAVIPTLGVDPDHAAATALKE